MNHLGLILHFRYLILIPLMIFEGPATTFVAAILASRQYFESSDIIVLSIFGNLAGDILHYLFGRFGGAALVNRWGHLIHLDEKRLDKLNSYFVRHGGKTLILGKVSIAFGGIALISAGLTRYSFWKFLLYNIIAEVPKSLFVFALGYYFGATIGNFNRYLLEYTLIFALLVVAFYLSYRLTRREFDASQ
jgi:membrane-associated protein